MINHSQSENLQIVATGVSYGALPNDEHAKLAVQNAIKKMAPCAIGSVLLFLSCGYAHKPQPAITLAAKAAGTPQIFGCCAMSLLTEQEWLLDAEGAVAMVFPREYSIKPLQVMQQLGVSPNLAITLCTPNAATIAVNSSDIAQMGAITTDEYGHGPFSVWQSGRIVEKEFSHNAFSPDINNIVKTAKGVHQISPIMQVNRSDGHRIIEVNQSNALDNLLEHLPNNLQSLGLQQPYNLLCAVSENTDVESIENGHYKLHHIVANDDKQRHIMLSGSIKAGRHLFWAIRDEKTAEQTMKQALLDSKQQLSKQNSTAKFCLMFPNIGRGPEFYNGRDRDLELFKEVFPNVPMIGFYGNGEIAPGHRLAGLIHRYSTVFSVFS